MYKADVHNFGTKVTRDSDGWYLKPRPTILEHLILDPTSLLRNLFGEHNLFDFLPDLSISEEFDFFRKARCQPATAGLNGSLSTNRWKEVCEKAGELLALMLWFGVNDLHAQNVVVEIDENSVLKLAPIDIETFLYKLILPHKTHLLPSINCPLEYAGLGFLYQLCPLDTFEFLPAIVFGYIRAIGALERLNHEIFCILRSYNEKRKMFSRVLMRESAFYAKILESKEADRFEGLFVEEKLQISQGQIPYFFREMDGDKIYFFSEIHRRSEIKSLDLYGNLSNQFVRLSDFTGFCESMIKSYLTLGVSDIVSCSLRFKKPSGEMKVGEYKSVVLSELNNIYNIKFGRLSVSIHGTA